MTGAVKTCLQWAHRHSRCPLCGVRSASVCKQNIKAGGKAGNLRPCLSPVSVPLRGQNLTPPPSLVDRLSVTDSLSFPLCGLQNDFFFPLTTIRDSAIYICRDGVRSSAVGGLFHLYFAKNEQQKNNNITIAMLIISHTYSISEN